jgi:hypothetical protein
MMYIVALLALLNSQGSIDGEQAIQKARDFAKQLQINCPLSITTLVYRDNNKLEPVWSIGFTHGQKEKGSVIASVDMHGKIVYFCAVTGDQKALPSGIAQYPSVLKQARELLDRLTDVEPVDRTPTIGTGEFFVAASFYVLRNGLRFYNANPSYRYLIGFDPGGESYRWFAPPPPLPPVASPTPTIKSSDAMKRAEKASKQNMSQMSEPKQIVGFEAKSKLGYFLVPGEATARLVWVIEMNVIRDLSGYRPSLFYRTFYVDAHRGMMFYVLDDATTVVTLESGDRK